MRTQTKWLVFSLVIGWFLGAASGLVLMRMVHPNALYDMHFGRARARLAHALNLTPDQQTQIEGILKTNRQKLDDIFAETQPRVEAIRMATAAQIRQLLTPDQQTRFDRITAKHNAEHKEHLEEIRKHHPPLI